MTMTTPSAAGLATLEARLKQDLAWLELPTKSCRAARWKARPSLTS
jgi:hypothetical protein